MIVDLAEDRKRWWGDAAEDIIPNRVCTIICVPIAVSNPATFIICKYRINGENESLL